MDVHTPGALRIDLLDVPLLFYAGRIADLLVVKSDGCNVGAVIQNTSGGWVAPYIAYRLAASDRHCSLHWQPTRTAPVIEAPAFFTTGRPAARGTAPSLLVADLGERLPARNAVPVPNVSIGNDIGGSLHVVVSHQPPTDPARTIDCWQTLDFEDAIHRFKLDGMPAEITEHVEYYTGIAARIRTISSDRSRAQAG